jgi:hypothetical protein
VPVVVCSQEFIAATMERNVYIREENIQRAFRYFDQVHAHAK